MSTLCMCCGKPVGVTRYSVRYQRELEDGKCVDSNESLVCNECFEKNFIIKKVKE